MMKCRIIAKARNVRGRTYRVGVAKLLWISAVGLPWSEGRYLPWLEFQRAK